MLIGDDKEFHERSINKETFITIVHDQLDKNGIKLPFDTLHDIINMTLYVISELLRNDSLVFIRNFGTFSMKLMKDKRMKDVKTGRPTIIKAHYLAKFKSSKALGFDSVRVGGIKSLPSNVDNTIQ